MTLDDLERPKRTLAEKNRLTEPPEKLNEDRHIISAVKCRSMILDSKNKRYVRILES